MAGLPYQQLERDAPESIVENYLQQGLQNIQRKYGMQWDEVNRRGSVLGQRKANEMLANIDMRAKQEIQEFQQQAQQQTEQLQRIDRLAQQSGTDPYEPKMRLVLSPEEEAARFPKETAPRSIAAQFGELDIYEGRLKDEAEEFITDPGGKRIKEPWKFWFREKKTRPMLKVYDPNLEPTYDEKKKVWTKGGYRVATQEDIRRKLLIERELKDVRRQKRELMQQPDIATRVRGAALRVKRDPEHTSFVEKVQQSKPKPTAPPTPKKSSEQLRKTGTRAAYDEGVRLGYWQ